MSDIDWGHRKPLERGDPGDFKQMEEEKMSRAVGQMKESGLFTDKSNEKLLLDYKKVLRGGVVHGNGIVYTADCAEGKYRSGGIEYDCKSAMGLLKDGGAKDVLEASILLDRLIELI